MFEKQTNVDTTGSCRGSSRDMCGAGASSLKEILSKDA